MVSPSTVLNGGHQWEGKEGRSGKSAVPCQCAGAVTKLDNKENQPPPRATGVPGEDGRRDNYRCSQPQRNNESRKKLNMHGQG